MDLLNVILNPNKNNVCCLCFKETELSIGLHDGIEIHDAYFNFNSTIGRLLKSLFPAYDIALTHICEDCSSLTIKMFSLLQRSVFKNEMLHYLLDKLNEDIEEAEYELVCRKEMQKYTLKLNLPSDESIMGYKKNKDIQCIKCTMKFKSESLLKKHINITHKNTNNAIICDICGKVFSKTSKLTAHLGCHQQKQCPYCSKTLKSNSHFYRHVRNHTSQVPLKRKSKYYACNHCGYRSVNKTTLETHLNKVHLGIISFKCDLCQKGFYKKNHLVQHLATHSKQKDKLCSICGDTFSNERTLKNHLKIHSGQKPYKCEICNIGFITCSRRNEHMKSKHMEKKEQCVICGKVFSLTKGLNAHLRKIHGAETRNNLFQIDLDD